MRSLLAGALHVPRIMGLLAAILKNMGRGRVLGRCQEYKRRNSSVLLRSPICRPSWSPQLGNAAPRWPDFAVRARVPEYARWNRQAAVPSLGRMKENS
jgi:hypothetical protein